MDSHEFIEYCKDTICKYVNEHLDRSDNVDLYPSDIFVVWSVKVLQNNKALLSTTLYDGMYYECTYNGDTEELYLDAYKKWENRSYDLNE